MFSGPPKLLRRAAERFFEIDGTQWAGALAYSAFASLFPMILLFITAASFLIDRERAARVVLAFVANYLPMSEGLKPLITATIDGMTAARGRAGEAAVLVLLWTSGECFGTFISATNRAWGAPAAAWWRLPLKNLLVLGAVAGAVPMGMTASMLARLAARVLAGSASTRVNAVLRLILPVSAEFTGLCLFYRLAPRRRTCFADVWPAACATTLLLRGAEVLFAVYLDFFSASNAVYGLFGGIMALLLWIYVSSCIFIFGACLCAARRELSEGRPFAVQPQ